MTPFASNALPTHSAAADAAERGFGVREKRGKLAFTGPK
jgi:hypothetical protein